MKTMKLPFQFMLKAAEIMPLKVSAGTIRVPQTASEYFLKTNMIVASAQNAHRRRFKNIACLPVVISLTILSGCNLRPDTAVSRSRMKFSNVIGRLCRRFELLKSQAREAAGYQRATVYIPQAHRPVFVQLTISLVQGS
jgi:hypothetical protein